MGYAFTFHVVSLLARIPIGAYVHYPTISTDMLARVKSRKNWHTNTTNISSSAILSNIKLLYASYLFLIFRRFLMHVYLDVRYYRLFMYYYAISLRTPSFVMVNSSWTKDHVDSILQHSDPLLDGLHLFPPLVFLRLFTFRNAPLSARIVYPPCDTREMAAFPLTLRQRVILSIAQFRCGPSFFSFVYTLKDYFCQPRKGPSSTIGIFPPAFRITSGICIPR